MVYVKQISGTHFPSFKGRLAVNGTYNGQLAYQLGMKDKWLWYDNVNLYYVLSTAKGTLGLYAWHNATGGTNPDGTYLPVGTACEGNPVIGPITTEGPHGLIALWSGSVATIPLGWVLCDGTNGTPDLRGKFIVGAGGSLAPGATGGTAAHSHTWSGTFGGGLNLGNSLIDSTPIGQRSYAFNGSAGGNTSSAANLPPYYALCFIMHL